LLPYRSGGKLLFPLCRTIVKVHEVWHYDKLEQYDMATNPKGGLFTPYIDKFMRQKQEADGWPA